MILAGDPDPGQEIEVVSLSSIYLFFQIWLKKKKRTQIFNE